ncbi:MAG: histidine kinase N-terminal 7TM domain-containing protein [Firmicutes bacterium]|nr:histidine kinase N-terminal 7TM domain-containing protein [Bacillota bacterium]
MRNKKQKNHIAFICAAGAVIAAMILRQIGFQTQGLIDDFCCILRSFIYIGLFVLWGVSVRRRIIQPQVRRYVTAISALTVLWLMLRTIKYYFVRDPLALRLLWYLYYLPMLFIPLLAVFVALSLGQPESFRLPKRTALLYIPTAALLALVLTNDLHQLVFSFPSDASRWVNDYSYAAGYYPVLCWMLLCAVAALIVMLIKCRVPNSRKLLIMPFVPCALALIYGVLYIASVPWLRLIAGDLTVVFCLFFAAVLESCIQCGLIQTNTGYGKLFEIGTIGAQIANEDYQVRYSSSNATEFSKETIRAAANGTVSIDKDNLLKSSRIGGGYVLWQENISDITATLEKLEENRKIIEENNGIQEENYKTKIKINALREKNRLYDQLRQKTAGEIDLLDGLLNQYGNETDPDKARGILAKTVVIGAYIKRRGNLTFIEEKTEMTDTAELAACLEESFAGLRFMNVECALDIPSGQTVSVKGAARVYDLFEAAIETALEDLRSVWLKGRALESEVVFNIEVETDTDLSQLAGAADKCIFEDGVWRFTVHIGKAGETA